MPGARCTRSLACKSVVSTRVSSPQLQPESPGIPARNGFNGFLRALPGDRAFLSPSSAEMVLSKPGRADLTSADLTPASRRQDHTILPSAKAPFVSTPFDRSQAEARPAITLRARRCRVHRIPSRVRDDRDTPLQGDETARDIDLIWVRWERENFCRWGWTGQITRAA